LTRFRGNVVVQLRGEFPPKRGLPALVGRCDRGALGHGRRGSVSFEREGDISHSGTARTRSFDVNVAFMQLERHGWDIHIVSAAHDPAAARDHRSQEDCGNTRAPGVAGQDPAAAGDHRSREDSSGRDGGVDDGLEHVGGLAADEHADLDRGNAGELERHADLPFVGGSSESPINHAAVRLHVKRERGRAAWREGYLV
jgi:hypothetical protein